MRRARYDLKQVICKNSSCIRHSSNIARPGYWITYGAHNTGRVLGRIAETDRPNDCVGYLAVMRLSPGMQSAGIDWVNPSTVTNVYSTPPAQLLAWITAPDWVESKHDIARIIAMDQHGATQEQFIATRDDPDKAYNARPEYVAQFILSD